MKIACLHTVNSNQALFEAAAAAEGVECRHVVREDLLVRAEQHGGLTDDIRDETARLLLELAENADAVLLTCSTLGPSVQRLGVSTATPVLRVDAALAEAAVGKGGRVVVLCTVSTTVQPTTELFRRVAGDRPLDITVEVVPGAWQALRSGDREACYAAVASAADAWASGGADVVAFAQASMAPAADRCAFARPLVSPSIGMAAAVTAARASI